jgi:hypothetical protein
VVKDRRVQPNHAWRYTFKTYSHDAGLNELTIDAICGHSARTMGEVYRGITVKKRMEVMAAFPRYQMIEAPNTSRPEPTWETSRKEMPQQTVNSSATITGSEGTDSLPS